MRYDSKYPLNLGKFANSVLKKMLNPLLELFSD